VIESALGIIGGIQFIPVLPDHEHYPDAPMTLMVSDDKSYAYVRIDEWPKIRAALVALTPNAELRGAPPDGGAST
jgi:hypothetical protein